MNLRGTIDEVLSVDCRFPGIRLPLLHSKGAAVFAIEVRKMNYSLLGLHVPKWRGLVGRLGTSNRGDKSEGGGTGLSLVTYNMAQWGFWKNRKRQVPHRRWGRDSKRFCRFISYRKPSVSLFYVCQ